jgi:sugar O-acyltransferase (sialic acid O-acetyltransferase NeuD family)
LVDGYINVNLIDTANIMDKPIMIFGASGIGKAAYEIFRSHDLMIYGFLDDRPEMHGKEIEDVLVLGSTGDDGYLKYIGQKCESFVATDDNKEKKSLVKMLKDRRKVMPVNAVHKNASLAPSVSISHGNFIDDGSVLGADVCIGNHNIIHAGVTIAYDVKIHDFVQIGAGAVISSGVHIGDEAFIGSGAVIVSGIKIGKRARIGAGSIVVDHVADDVTVFGNPAKPVKI